MNALKHGLRATDELFLSHLRPRERAIMDSLRASLHQEYNPQTSHEKLLVDRMAIQHLRLFRLYRFEYDVTRRAAGASALPYLDRFSRYDSAVERGLRALHNRLCSLYHMRRDYSLSFLSSKE